MISKGLEGIVANSTRLSDVLGDKGQLIYAGYDINELAGKVSFEETIYLLWNERLPKRAELEEFSSALRQQRELPRQPARRRSDGRDPHGGVHARAVRHGEGRLARGELPALSLADGEDGGDRRVFPSRADRQGPAACPSGSRGSGAFSLFAQR